MKKFALFAVLFGGTLFTTGCQTPGYTAQERFQLIGRNSGYQYEQINDDVDNLLLLRPTEHLSQWNLQ